MGMLALEFACVTIDMPPSFCIGILDQNWSERSTSDAGIHNVTKASQLSLYEFWIKKITLYSR